MQFQDVVTLARCFNRWISGVNYICLKQKESHSLWPWTWSPFNPKRESEYKTLPIFKVGMRPLLCSELLSSQNVTQRLIAVTYTRTLFVDHFEPVSWKSLYPAMKIASLNRVLWIEWSGINRMRRSVQSEPAFLDPQY